jgi:hypothetical protein
MATMLSMMKTGRAFTLLLSRRANISRFIREYKRTHGISTTDITERILNMENPEFEKTDQNDKFSVRNSKRFYATISKFVQFFDDRFVNTYFQGKIVYVTGTFDLLRILIRFGTYLLFGAGEETW